MNETSELNEKIPKRIEREDFFAFRQAFSEELIETMEELTKKKDEGKKRSRRRGMDSAVLCRGFCFSDPRFRCGIGPVKGHGIPQHARSVSSRLKMSSDRTKGGKKALGVCGLI